jgi:hypothetical protein
MGATKGREVARRIRLEGAPSMASAQNEPLQLPQKGRAQNEPSVPERTAKNYKQARLLELKMSPNKKPLTASLPSMAYHPQR